jgi:hypothetical protein
MASSTSLDPAEIIAWYAEMGVTIALGETPVDRLNPALAPSAP